MSKATYSVTSTKWIDEQGLLDTVDTCGKITAVVRGKGYSRPGTAACLLTDTNNGFIARFPAHSSVDQDYYVCLDYSQARDLVLALSAHKKELGFK